MIISAVKRKEIVGGVGGAMVRRGSGFMRSKVQHGVFHSGKPIPPHTLLLCKEGNKEGFGISTFFLYFRDSSDNRAQSVAKKGSRLAMGKVFDARLGHLKLTLRAFEFRVF